MLSSDPVFAETLYCVRIGAQAPLSGSIHKRFAGGGKPTRSRG